MGASEESWRHRLSERARFVAEVEGHVVGIVGAGPGEFSGAAALTALWVDPRFRSQGVGTALVEAVLDWAKGEGFSQVLLWVTEMNQKAERLYERHGFALWQGDRGAAAGAGSRVRDDQSLMRR